MKDRTKTWKDYVFCLAIGGIYLYALTRTIFAATVFYSGTGMLVTTGVVAILAFLIITYNRFTFFITLGGVLLYGVRLLFSLRGEYLHPVLDHFNRLALMIMGVIPHDPTLERTAIWVVSAVFGAVVVFFMFARFNFPLLGAVGIAVFIATWAPGFVRDEVAFMLFLFVFCVLLIRKMNSSMSAMVFIVPLCALAVWLTNARMPIESEIFVRRPIDQLQGPVDAISDRLYEIFNPTYFSFQSTGFSGAGGRLGGAVTPNNRAVMTVNAPGGTYLAGATSNIYTGYSWIPALYPGQINTHGLAPGEFEMLETAVALIRGATIVDVNAVLSTSSYWGVMPTNSDARDAGRHNFQTVGVRSGDIFVTSYLHSYLPFSEVTIGVGRNRTGTIFRPNRAWDLVFNPVGNDYLPVTEVLSSGDMQTPRMMSRDTTYHFQFLNVNTSLTFLESILQNTNAGMYSSIPQSYDINDIWQRTISFNGETSPVSWLLLQPDIFSSMLSSSVILDDDMVFSSYRSFDEPLDEDLVEYTESRITLRIINPEGNVLVRTDIELPQSELPPALFWREPEDYEDLSHIGVNDIIRLLDSFRSARVTYDVYSEWHLTQMLDAFSKNVLAEYARQVRQHFMQVPDITPQRVHDLTHSIVAGKTNDFDRVMAIRDYLLQFPYTLNTVPVPPGVCFVDHFLFGTQEGYCTYFASAMAVMARIAGVPSRYVEGFILPPSLEAYATVTVTNRMAHAWVEVYLEGFGWLLVEATPTYAFIMNPTLPLPPQGVAGSNPFHDPDWLRAMAEGRAWEHEEDMDAWMEQMLGTTGPGGSGTAPQNNNEEPIDTRNALDFIWVLPVLAVAGILTFLVLRRIQIKRGLKKVHLLPANEQALIYFKGIMDVVTYYTVPLAPGETPQIYGEHKGKRFAFQSDSVFFRDLIALYYKAKYAPHQISEDERALMEEAYFDMLRLLRQVRWRYRVMYLQYVRGLAVLSL